MKTQPRILIVGAGPVGLAIAAGLQASLPAGSASVRVLDAGPPPAPPSPDAAWDPRVFAASRASQRLLRRIGAWQRIPTDRIQAYSRMQVWEEASSLGFDAGDVGVTDLGHIVENTWIRAAIFGEIARIGTISCIFDNSVEGVSFDGVTPQVTTDTGEVLSADLLVAADGAGSATRRLVGLGEAILDHDAEAVVCHLRTEVPHGSVARQRFLATGPLALLPLADGRVSLVWSTTRGDAATLTDMDEDGFNSRVSEASGFVLGQLAASTPRMRFPLRSLTADEPQRHGLVLVGDAAHTVHPLAGQGMNLGLLDAAALVELVTEAIVAGESPGALRTLRRFHRRRDRHNRIMQRAFGLIDRTFRNDGVGMTLLRRAGLATADRVAPLRRLLVRQAMGLDGDLPALMRDDEEMVSDAN